MKQILFACIFSLFCTLGYSQIVEGIKHLENENYAAATEAFNQACKADSKNGVAHYWIGEVAFAQEDYAGAEKSYKKGVEAGNCAECYVGLGKLMLNKGNVAEAEKNFELAKRIDKKKASTYGLIGDAYLYSKTPNATKAIENLGNARDMDPKNAVYWAHLGDAFILIRDNGQAMSAYEDAIVKDPTNSEAYIKMARIWSAAKQTDLAIEKLEKAIELSPNDARPIKFLYELYISKRQYSKVVPLLEKYISLAGKDNEAKVRLVKFLTFQAKDYERAIIEGEKLMASNVNDYTLHRWLAWSYTGMAKQLETDRESGQEYDTVLVKSHYCKGLENSKKLFDAVGKDNSRKAFPEDYDFWALAALKCGSLDDAAHIYRKYIELDSTRAGEIYSILAKTYYDSTRYDQAINYYNRKMETKSLSNAEEYYL
ncbi:MAG: tetratricopeptide repeat protein, partial [Bacteroidota bacterium]|nr:tetratricopeptide repeat protein [Bacteroidota bacterium]